ncbi:MAG: hypothetical protein JO349_10170, partial [Candidatus Eremiobacteraeota bacterium]|nr:hypothetical protein [Candidatus Eremiobacteraeota bacterium]
MIAVTYDRAAFSRAQANFTRNEQNAGGMLLRNFDYPMLNKTLRVIAVSPAQQAAAMASIRTQSGVVSVAPTGFRRYRTKVTTPVLTNDPYFEGFTAGQITTGGATGAATFGVGPYYEDAGVP